MDQDLTFPQVVKFTPRVNLEHITSKGVESYFSNAIKCYNQGLYEPSMVMSRKAVECEVNHRKAEGKNLFRKIESLGISFDEKELLQKIKNVGNHGAHSERHLLDKEGVPIEDEEYLAELSLILLDLYLRHYEVAFFAKNGPGNNRLKKSS